MKKTFIFYTDWKDYTEEMTLEEKGLFLQTILLYQDGKEVGDISSIKFIRSKVKKQLDEDNSKREQQLKVRSELGKLGGLAKASKSYPTASKRKLMVADNVNDNVNKNVNVNKKELYKEKESQLIADVGKFGNEYPGVMLKQFKEYWLEKDKNNKPRFLGEKYFEVGRRISTRALRAGVKKNTITQAVVTPKIEITEEQRKNNLVRLASIKKEIFNKGST